MTSKEALLELICELKSLNCNEERVSFLRNEIEKDLELLESIKEVFSKVVYAPYAEIEVEDGSIITPKAKLAEEFDKELFRQVLEQCGFEIKEK